MTGSKEVVVAGERMCRHTERWPGWSPTPHGFVSWSLVAKGRTGNGDSCDSQLWLGGLERRAL
jgi:hypothetical protein